MQPEKKAKQITKQVKSTKHIVSSAYQNTRQYHLQNIDANM